MATFTGDNSSNFITGGDADDTILGLGGDDTLNGAGGNDTIDGGSGNDVITGGPGTDMLTGGTGADTFVDTAAGLNGDTITDFSPGDRIQISDLPLASANINLVGNTITYGMGATAGSITIGDGIGAGRYVLRAIGTTGVEIRFQADAHNDFNGDGRSDLLLRNDSGSIFDLVGTNNGGLINNGDNSFASIATSTHVVGTGDFNGDGRVDLLWRNDDGSIHDLLANANGGFTDNTANSFVSLPTSWHVAGIGDFNGDGHDDILWRNDSGAIMDFLGTANGGFTSNGDNSSVNVDPIWHVAGVGDFNGDGLSDVLWRNDSGVMFDFLGTANGGFVNNGDNSFVAVDSTTQLAGIGDFSGDGLSDLLWRNSAGTIFDFLGQANGGFVNNGDNSAVTVGSTWHVASIGDFNGDAVDDILWRNDNGVVFDFLGKANGGFVNNGDNSFIAIDTSWHVQDPFA
jgi:hypothetical protein